MACSSLNSWFTFALLILIVVISTTLNQCAASTIYVNGQTGSDSNPGTAALPVKTLSAGINLAATNDTISLSPGVYSGSLNFPVIKKSVTIAGLRPTLTALFACTSSAETWTITAPSVSLRNIQMGDCTTAITASSTVLAIKQSIFRNCTTGISATQSNVLLSYTAFFENSFAAVNLDDSKTTTDNTYFRANTLGLLASNSVVNLTSTSFQYNRQTSPTMGAAMHFISSIVSTNALNIEANSAVNGAGLYAISSAITMNRSDILNSNAGTPVWLQDSRFTFNYGNLNYNVVSGNGGGLTATLNSIATFSFSNIMNNVAGQQGSPFFCSSGGVAFASPSNNSIMGNKAGSNPQGNC